MSQLSRFARLYRIPLLLAVLTTIGLVSALLEDGIWDAFSWVLLAVPLMAVLYCCRGIKA